MRILLAHNFYRQGGGEDAVYRAEIDLLQNKGHEVFTLEADNKDLDQQGRLQTMLYAFHNKQQTKKITEFIREKNIDVVHFHNIWLQFSPAIFAAARQAGAATVLSLHNFRICCANSMLFREGNPCEDCVGKSWAWRGIVRKCYRSSYVDSAFLAGVFGLHKAKGTWRNQVDRYLALNPFAKEIFLRAGLPEEKIGVKANFVGDLPDLSALQRQDHFLFVGRLEEAKGPDLLLKAWQKMTHPPRLKIVGEGHLRPQLEALAATLPKGTVEFTGWLKAEQIPAEIAQAKALLFPGQVYENFPMTIATSFACGTPVIASNLGAMTTIIVETKEAANGWLVDPQNPICWQQLIESLEQEELSSRGTAARHCFETKYSAEIGYQRLIEEYQLALEQRKK